MKSSSVSGVSKFALCGVVHSFSVVGSSAILGGNRPTLNSSPSASLESRRLASRFGKFFQVS